MLNICNYKIKEFRGDSGIYVDVIDTYWERVEKISTRYREFLMTIFISNK